MTDLDAALAHFWHPVCTLSELRSTDSGVGPLAIRLLEQDLVVVDLDGRPVAMVDRCVHRSTRLSVGWVDDGCLRCPYHGWAYDRAGRCVDIPAMPDGPIPPRARTSAFDTVVAYDTVWVRLDSSVDTVVPACDSFGDDTMKTLQGSPYTWPVGAPRRVENFVDLSHFAWVHDGSLCSRDLPVPPIPDVERSCGDHGAELRFAFDPPIEPPDDVALVARSEYRMPMPLTVDIHFLYDDGRRRDLWMTASPIDPGTCRTFWFVSRTDDLDGDDRAHLAFQDLVLAEDEPVVCNQVPRALPLDPGVEVSVRSDKVSIEYRRWLRELATAAADGSLGPALGAPMAPMVADGLAS
jgi:vanillate O-demethylase monooxygenase subunit